MRRRRRPVRLKATAKDLDALEALTEFRRTHDYGPTLREVSEIALLPFGTVQGAMARLRRLGLVGWDRGISRSLRLLGGKKD